MPPTFRPSHLPSRREQNRAADARRGSARARGYDSRWDREAKRHLAENPLCRYCALVDQVAAASLVDHLYPHRGDWALFWNRVWWVSSCGPCHNVFKQRVERRGRAALDALAVRLSLPVLS